MFLNIPKIVWKRETLGQPQKNEGWVFFKQMGEFY